MTYRSETIISAVRKLNNQYFLPAIQREFVWGPDQIIQLFDSVLRGYPISSFLFWELLPDHQDKWRSYKFIDRASDRGTHNEVANTGGVNNLFLILDGQQRLTSLNIGLRGYYEVKVKYGRWDNPQSWSQRKLFINLLHDPQQGEAEDGDGIYYQLGFITTAPKPRDDSYWFELGRVLSCQSEGDFEELKEDIVESLPDTATKEQMRLVRKILDRLYRAIHIDQFIAYYLEEEQDYDRVLDIFVRANAGGTKLSKSDLLMSTVTASWAGTDAREEIHGFVEQLNWELTRKNNFDKDFVMKSCLVLTDLPVKYRVQNFNHVNLTKIRDNWGDIKRSLRATVEFVNQCGADRDNLTSANALIPLAYFLLRHPEIDLTGSSQLDMSNRQAMRKWLLGVLLTGAFSSSTDSALTEIRSVLQKFSGDTFPAKELNDALRKLGRASRPEDVLESVMGFQYGRKATVLALSLLYPDMPWGTVPHHVDHIFSRNKLSFSALNRPGEIGLYWRRDAIENLCLLTESENESKGSRDLDDWLSTRDDAFLDRHLIPRDRNLWKIEAFGDFIKSRRELLQAKLAEVLNVNFPEGETIESSEE